MEVQSGCCAGISRHVALDYIGKVRFVVSISMTSLCG
jgi:hypothetical protein